MALTLGVKAQHVSHDTIIKAWPDTLLVGDTLHIAVYYNYQGISGEDSMFLAWYNTRGLAYLHDFDDVFSHSIHDTATFINNVTITANYIFTDSTYTKINIYLVHGYNNTDWSNNPEKFVYIKDTVHHPADTNHNPSSINAIIGTNYTPIREVHYYTMTGQLYGSFPLKQNHLPNIPLIEEVIYTDNSISTRTFIRIN